MTSTTITEALAELKTIEKRVAKKQQFVQDYLFRQERLKDPHEKDGGSVSALKRERQAIRDLQERVIRIRTSIARVNSETTIEVDGERRTIAEWLVWRRDVAPEQQRALSQMRQAIINVRDEARKKSLDVISAGDTAKSLNDIIVNVNEQDLASEAEHLEQVLGVLDGQLSLKNATVFIDV